MDSVILTHTASPGQTFTAALNERSPIAHSMAEVMQSTTHLSAGGASCQICFEPFGNLEDLSAPFTLVACGHVLCMGCLHDTGACCPICGLPYDRTSYVRLLNLRSTTLRRPCRSYDSEATGAKLRQEFARISNLTGVAHLRSLHNETRYFLDSQPRNRFNDLEVNDQLLQCVLETKETLHAQSAMVNTLVEQIHHLGSEKIDLSLQLIEMERRHTNEREFIRNHISDILRRDPDFNLLSEEVLQFQSDMNELRETLHHLQVESSMAQRYITRSPTPIPPVPEPRPQRPLEAPELGPQIRVYPASRSPSPAPSAPESAYESLSPLSMSAIGDDFGTAHPQHPGSNVPRTGSSARMPTLNNDPRGETQAVATQIRRRSRMAYSSAPDLRSLSVAGGRVRRANFAAVSEAEEDEILSLSFHSSEAIHDGDGETPYYSPLTGSSTLDDEFPPLPETTSPSLDEDIRHNECENEASGTPETAPRITESASQIDHASVLDYETTLSTPISTISTPSLPLLRSPPQSHLLEDFETKLNQLLAPSYISSSSTQRLITDSPSAGTGISSNQSESARLPRRHRGMNNSMRALNELFHDLIGGRAHSDQRAVQGQPGGGLILSDMGASLMEVFARFLVHLASNTTASTREMLQDSQSGSSLPETPDEEPASENTEKRDNPGVLTLEAKF